MLGSGIVSAGGKAGTGGRALIYACSQCAGKVLFLGRQETLRWFLVLRTPYSCSAGHCMHFDLLHRSGEGNKSRSGWEKRHNR